MDGVDLSEILNRWKSDKAMPGPGPAVHRESHGYAGVYECLFRRWRAEVTAVLEIGIGTITPGAHSSMFECGIPGYRPGGSLHAWQEYFPNALILGLDVQPDTQFSDDRIITRLCDSTNSAQVAATMTSAEIPRSFDLVIDDGSHTASDQLATMANFFRYVKAGGFYVAEDLHDDFGNIGLLENIEQVRDICEDSPFFFLGPYNNVLVILKRG